MKIRQATRADVQIIFDLIMELAIYEKLEDEVVTDTKTLETWIFDKDKAKVLVGEVKGEVVGYCLYFYNFSTFHGKAGIYIEDVYVRETYRGHGYGTAFFKQVAKIAQNEGCVRIDWSCLKWNVSSIAFYKALGAITQEEWLGFRLEADAIKELSQGE